MHPCQISCSPYPSAHPLPKLPEPEEELHQEPEKELHQASGISIHQAPEEDAHHASEPAAKPDPAPELIIEPE